MSQANALFAIRYGYGPFGEVIRVTERMAKSNPFTFSTEYEDNKSDIVAFPYRFYEPGRFLTRDPVGEPGASLLYGFGKSLGNDGEDSSEETSGPNLNCAVQNDPVNTTDPLGLFRLKFKILTGMFFSVSDKYTNPAGYGYGVEDTDGRDYARDMIVVHSGNPTGNGVCNTVMIDLAAGRNEAGSIEVSFVGDCPGDYSVDFNALLLLNGVGPVGKARATLTNGQSPPFYFARMYARQYHPDYKLVPATVNFTLTKAGEERKILIWRPIIAMPPHNGDSFGRADASIIYVGTRLNGVPIDY